MTARTTVRPDRSAYRHTTYPVAERAHLALVGRRRAAVEAGDDRGTPAYRQLEQQLSQLRSYIDHSYIDDGYIDRTEAHDRAEVRYRELLADHLSGLLAVAYASGVPRATASASSARRGIGPHLSVQSELQCAFDADVGSVRSMTSRRALPDGSNKAQGNTPDRTVQGGRRRLREHPPLTARSPARPIVDDESGESR